MDALSSVSALYSVVSAQKAMKAEGEAVLLLLQQTLEVQQEIAETLTASGSSIDIYV